MLNPASAESIAKVLGDMLDPVSSVTCKGCTECCCGACADATGYFYFDDYIHELDPETFHAHVSRMKEMFGFDADKGFLGPEGCKIPRKFRSSVCNGFMCERFAKEFESRITGTDSAVVPILAEFLSKANGKELYE